MRLKMGYFYTNDGKLICDCCQSSHDVEKIPCPFGYCPPIALCPDCREKFKDKLTEEYHRSIGCDRKHNAFIAREKHRDELVKSGKMVRRAALAKVIDGKKIIHVLFDTRDGTVGYYMNVATYHAIPLSADATIDHYRAFGECWPAPASFYD